MAGEDDNVNSGDSSKKSIGTSYDLNLSFGDSLYLHPNDTGGSPILIFLMGLDDSYLAIRSNILIRDPLPLVKVAFAIVSAEEFHRNINSVRTTKPTATAFAAKTFDKKRHIMDRCFELVGYPAGYAKKNFIPNTRPVSSNNTSADIHSNNASSIGHPNATQALITKIIDLKLNIDITLYDVLVVPEYTVSLLSVHKLSRD
ncbi:hypothetical protein Tco_1259244, partial [Tanacetum coccineum]